MSSPHTQAADATPCLAIPGAARRGWRSDFLCASLASTGVEFRGRRVAVCRMHEATYDRWGADAEQRAIELWGWNATAPSEG